MATGEELPDFAKLWDFNAPAETRKRFEEVLSRAEASGDRSYHLQLLTQIARTYGLERNFDDAHRVLDQVEQGLADDLQVARLRYLLERGRAHNTGGDPKEAKPFFEQAWELGRQWGHDLYAIDAAHMVAIVEPEAAKQHEWNLKALELAEASGDERARRWLGSLYNNIGMTHLDAGEYDQALALFEKQRDHYAERGSAESQRIARWMIAHTYRKMGRVDDALQIQRAMEKQLADDGRDDDGFVAEEIAECLLAQGSAEEAKPYFRRAYSKLVDIHWVKESDPKRLPRLKRLGEQA